MSTPLWIKSSYSSEQGGNCVEVATGSDCVRVRDSKDTSRPLLRFDNGAWAGLLGYVTGEQTPH
ncbi:DUF397 domain-containing protein [Streptomyces sp. NPDC007088]|uniref:DUF397 domain-containing protein n=1 Tax=Streptomyces sp. NPDC007088 TaxID=3364773 RepID=UPI0036CF0B40